jgi:hypothetical protein
VQVVSGTSEAMRWRIGSDRRIGRHAGRRTGGEIVLMEGIKFVLVIVFTVEVFGYVRVPVWGLCSLEGHIRI